MILTNGANSLTRGGDTVTIGGRAYPVVKIGNQLWMAENLDWKFTGCVIGASGTSTSEPRGNYYNNDETTYGVNGNKYGLLYNWLAATQINSLLTDGWKVPTNTDFTTLKNFVSNDSSKLKATSIWSPVGTDDYKFSAVPNGNYSANDSTFSNIGIGCDYWSQDSYNSNRAYDMYLRNANNNVNQSNDRKDDLYAIRLVKDAT